MIRTHAAHPGVKLARALPQIKVKGPIFYAFYFFK